jgi:hypothetical protein
MWIVMLLLGLSGFGLLYGLVSLIATHDKGAT